MRTYSKKGSLQLSINAIVVLVLAITMLGIGISFTKGLFNNVKFDTTVDLSDPSFNDQWSIPSRELDFATNGDTKINVKFRNTASFTYSADGADIVPSIVCKDDDGEPILIDPIAASEEVASGDVVEYYFIIKQNQMVDFVPGGTYSCKFIACQDDEGANSVECSADGSDNVYSSKSFIMNAKTA